MVALGAFGSGIAFALNMRVITVAGASTAAFVTYLMPLVAVALGIMVLGESLTWNQPVGAAIVLLGVAVAQGVLVRRPGKPRTRPAEVLPPGEPVAVPATEAAAAR
jgi:threonine/homoserine efflux transporter RhtA